MAAHQGPPPLGFSRQEHWSGLPFPSPLHKSEKWKWSCSVVSDSSWPHGLQPTRLLHPWIFQARVLEWGAIAFSFLLMSVATRFISFVYDLKKPAFSFIDCFCCFLPLYFIYFCSDIMICFLLFTSGFASSSFSICFRWWCSVLKSCLTLCNLMDSRTLGSSVLNCLQELPQIYGHWVSDVIQPSHPLLSPSPPALNLSQHQGLFLWVRSFQQVAKVLELRLQHQSS